MADETLLTEIIPNVRIKLQDFSEPYQYRAEDLTKLVAFNIAEKERLWNQGYALDALPALATKVVPAVAAEYVVLISWLVYLDLYPTLDKAIRTTSGFSIGKKISNWAKDKNPYLVKQDLIIAFQTGDITESDWGAEVLNTNQILEYPMNEMASRR